MRNSDLFRNEDDYSDFPVTSAIDHLSGAISYPTVSYVDTKRIDYSAFDDMQEYLRRSFPLTVRKGIWQRIGHSLLIKIEGTNDTLSPAFFMAHQDVVPIQPGTEGNWIHAPFSGDVEEGYIWGRGAMDIKQMLISELESVEYLLSKGAVFKRTVYLAFGEDEESCSSGARATAEWLRERGISLEYVLDEGAGEVTDAADWGAPGTLICAVGMYEKGYGDMRLKARSTGGHSSNPYQGTSLGHIANAIAAVANNPPKPKLSESIRHTLQTLLPYMSVEPMKTWAADPDKYENELTEWFLSHESLYHLVRTTIAPTMISGGSPAGNVMPQDMEAVINFRMIPGDTPEAILDYYRGVLDDGIEIDWVQKIGASVPSLIDSYGFKSLKTVLEHYFDRLIFVPVQNRGATDARWYEGLSKCVMRFGPFLEEEEISSQGVHGTNERISVRAFSQGIRVLIRLIEQTCIGE